MRKTILVWEIAGIFFIVVTGSSLHFLFEWSGRFLPVAFIAAVNESVWEHLKLAFWPSLIFAAIEYPLVWKYANNFITAKAAAVYIMSLFIVIVFYSYTAIVGHSILAVDIATFVLAVAAGQITCYAIMERKELPRSTGNAALAALVILTLAFSVFTFFPPGFALFEDSRNGEYGIPAGIGTR